MSLMMKTARPNTIPVQYVELTTYNMQEVAFLVRGSIKGTRIPVADREIEFWDVTIDSEVRIKVGDIVVQHGSNQFDVMSKKRFDLLYH